MPDMGIIIPIMGMTLYDKNLSAFLFNKTRRALLALLFSHPDESFYVNQVLQSLNAGSGAVQRELKMMTSAGIITRERRGNLVYYRANPKNPIFNEIKAIVNKTFGVADTIRESLDSIRDKIVVAFIFGSVAARTETRVSDIDLMIIGEVDFGDVASAISGAQDFLKREINPVVYPAHEFQKKIKENHHFVKSVLGAEKIFVIGDENELGRLV
jgi:DNA-binding transcriptional ArsR family regulator